MIFLEFAKRNIRTHPLRSGLAMLGIVIGVVAIVSMGILGNSMVLSISESLGSVGDSVIVSPNSGAGGGMRPGAGSSSTSSDLKITDLQYSEIQRLVVPSTTIAVRSGSDRIKIGSEETASSIYALKSDDMKELLTLTEGTYPVGSSSGVLVGPTFAADHKLTLGSRIQVGQDGNKGTLRVVGIIEKRGMSFDISTDSAMVVSKDWYDAAYGEDDYNQVVVKVHEPQTTANVKALIERKYNKPNNKIFTVVDSKESLETIYATFGQVTTFVTAIGGIALIVAGVSILNIMMMSVTERTREIGIMRSIGAQRKEVMHMFLYEAVILGIVGSAAGGILSVIGGYAISALMLGTIKYLFVPSNLASIAEGICLGIGICIVCGMFPAWKASNLNPIEALRHE